MQSFREHEKSRKSDTTKILQQFPVTKPKDMEIYDLPDKEFIIAVLRKLSELQGNTKNNIRKTTSYKQKEKFN